MSFKLIASLATSAALLAALAAPAAAGCRIRNETKYSFTVTSGNVSNQKVGSNTTTTIAAGTITGKSDDGKTIGGSCKEGDDLVIKDEKGIPVLTLKQK
jgi:hypothetical protein